MGTPCNGCGGCGLQIFPRPYYPGQTYRGTCEECDGRGWNLFELEGREAILAARSEGLLCLPPNGVCAGIERHPHALGCQAREHVVCSDKWVQREVGRGLTERLRFYSNYRKYFGQVMNDKVCAGIERQPVKP
jgi:hypothetical protein